VAHAPSGGRGHRHPTAVCNHTFRATNITTHLDNGGSLENAQAMAAHGSPRTTKLYDRTDDQITFDEVEKIGMIASLCARSLSNKSRPRIDVEGYVVASAVVVDPAVNRFAGQHNIAERPGALRISLGLGTAAPLTLSRAIAKSPLRRPWLSAHLRFCRAAPCFPVAARALFEIPGWLHHIVQRA
jgi:hypothetical protein